MNAASHDRRPNLLTSPSLELSPRRGSSTHYHDIDNNVASIALQHNLLHRRMLELASTSNTSTPAAQQQVQTDIQPLFSDMISNQIIVSSTYVGLLASDPSKAQKLLQVCLSSAKQLQSGMWNGEQLDSAMLERLSLNSGISGSESAEEKQQQLASDILTVLFGLEMLPNLLNHGNLHTQTAASQAYNLHATVKYARRFVALYQLLSSTTVDTSRICIKIPSTIPGLQAMRYLSSGGHLDESHLGGPLSEGKIQGLAAAQASRAIYTAPYINALAAHSFTVENPSEDGRKKALEAGARSVKEIIIPLQRCLLRLRKDDARIKTQVMAASFLSIEEAIQLCGLDHQTLGAPIVEGLANTELTAEHKRKVEEARGEFGVASDAELEEFGASVAAKEAEEVGYGGWLKEGSESYRRLANVLSEDERCKYMLDDALARFSRAEVNLRQLF
ncbi:related to transaldolase [Ustilago sp. UG-2017a]|nr:related to transaldolase [Ustilago sp. UG-2017a]